MEDTDNRVMEKKLANQNETKKEQYWNDFVKVWN